MKIPLSELPFKYFSDLVILWFSEINIEYVLR